LVASGCLTQRYSQELAKEMPEVDLFVGLSEFDKLAEMLRERFSDAKSFRRIRVGERMLPETAMRAQALGLFSFPANLARPRPPPRARDSAALQLS
jgi:tRNA A37 methylthiotransferase MiaB